MNMGNISNFSAITTLILFAQFMKNVATRLLNLA